MLYAADVFLTAQVRSKKRRGAGSIGRSIVTKLAAVQRRAALAITGGMRSSPGDTLDVLANLLPFPVLLQQHRLQAALRLASLPSSHPLSKVVARSATRFVKRYPTQLHFLMEELKQHHIKIKHVEKLKAVRWRSTWDPELKLEIASSKEEAADADAADGARLQVYSDGSGLDGRIGAAAVLFRDGKQKNEARYYLGSAKKHTVYEGESVGAVLALGLIASCRKVRAVTLCIDSQATIKATKSQQSVPGHYIMDGFHAALTALCLKHRRMQLTIRWVPGHINVEGNEAADYAARLASTGDETPRSTLPAFLQASLPHSKAAARQCYRLRLKKRGARIWKKSIRHERTSRLLPSTSSARLSRKLATLPRKHTSLITQIITGHIPLAHHLSRIGSEESAICPCCHEQDETIAHYFLHCPVHSAPRAQMFARIPRQSQNLTHMLSTPPLRRCLLTFISRTGRFRSVFGTLPILADPVPTDNNH
ncbi:hypothetical protein D9619_013186 [Psilocybe cf. subviscida]|uniref:RNase H type-1 domain-containing protein n=1 Tax=Psilocybe cf. subviscida TaxID=2480587 RepID=A0A8H5B7B8_9AGAR|nr:hypothetical protein D9619_013186 [Psilocybe cf. subviscida]